jgi:hypothetical protein
MRATPDDPIYGTSGALQEACRRFHSKHKELCGDVREALKAAVEGYKRVSHGRVQQDGGYQTHRATAMNATRVAHAATDEAHRMGGEGAHALAMKAHLAAVRAHHEARRTAPYDVTSDHDELLAHHRAAARYHQSKSGESDSTGAQPEGATARAPQGKA